MNIALKAVRTARSIAACIVAICLLPIPARATIVTQPYPIVPHTTASASQVQADFSTIYGAFNGNIDASNLASGSGIYASQIIPDSSGHATFGGSIGYTFQGGVTTLGTLSANVGMSTAFSTNASDGQPVVLFPSNNAGNETSLGVNTSASYPYFSLAKLSSSGVFQSWLLGIDSSSNLQVPGGSVITPNNLVFGSGGTGGTLYGVTGGGHNSGDIAHSGNLITGGSISVTGGITTNGFINNAPATITGNLTSSGITNTGNISTTGSISGPQMVATTGGTNTQVLPFLIAGSAITNRLNAHGELVSVGAAGTYSFTKPFDVAPICIGATSVGTTTTQYTTTTNGTFFCAGQ